MSLGYGATLSSSVFGSITGIVDMNIGGVSVSFEEIICLDSTDYFAEKAPGVNKEDPIDLTIKYVPAMYDTLRDAAIARAQHTFTLTDQTASVHAGLGYVGSVGNVPINGQHSTFKCQLVPVTKWDFTAA